VVTLDRLLQILQQELREVLRAYKRRVSARDGGFTYDLAVHVKLDGRPLAYVKLVRPKPPKRPPWYPFDNAEQLKEAQAEVDLMVKRILGMASPEPVPMAFPSSAGSSELPGEKIVKEKKIKRRARRKRKVSKTASK